MEPHKYEINVYWSAEDGVFVAEVPELPGCTAHGANPADAVGNVEDAIALWIDTALEDGVSVPAPRSRRASIA